MTLAEGIAAGRLLVCDGAMGTLLQAMGLQPGDCPEAWCLDRPDAVRDVHRRYREAGSLVVETNSFGASRFKLRHFGLEAKTEAINRAAAALARDIAGRDQAVLASMGPTGEFMAPLGDVSEADMIAAFREQAEAFAAGGADAVIVETMSSLEEAGAAVRAVRDATTLAVVASFTFSPRAGGGFATMMGVQPADAARAAAAWGVDAVGSNCGTGPDAMVGIVRELRAAAPDLPVLAMPNAGLPVLRNGVTVFEAAPETMAAYVPALVEAGAGIIGGCCGTTPDHIRAMRAAVDASEART